jgi:glycine/D-amino acid oxidase-like deaminating enzyme
MRAIFDVVVIGGGVIGMAFAYRARKLGFSVAVIEREKKANGGSIRNFGMIWPIGQPVGKLRDRAMD